MEDSTEHIIQIGEKNTESIAHFIFGRFQPPTIGHGALVKAISESAGDGDAYVFASSTQDAKKNPMNVEQKIKWLKKMFSQTYPNVKFINTTKCPIFNTEMTTGCKNPIVAVEALKRAGYTTAVLYAGSDRAPQYETTMKRCNFDGIIIQVETVGKQREPETIVDKKRSSVEIQECPNVMNMEIDEDNDISGISGTKMRKYATDCNIQEFKKGCVAHLTDDEIKELIGEIRIGMKLSPECPVINGGKGKRTRKSKRTRKGKRKTKKDRELYGI